MGKRDTSGSPPALLIRALLNPAAFDHPVDNVRIIQTHISWVLLTGAFAYKIKKPVSLGFADFSTLEKRRAACQEEIRLNLRLASQLYIGVVPICGSVDAPVVNGAGEAIEYAVKMRQFPDECRLDRFLEQGRVHEEMVRQLASEVADFHSRIEVAEPEQHVQESERRFSDIADNFEAVKALFSDAARAEWLEELRQWSLDSLVVNGDHFRKRKRDGFVRECHGDMHLANMAFVDDKITIFDALEFNPDLRWTDVMSEVAFVIMDLVHHARPDLASIFLSSYLESTGDYDGLILLRHFLVYRSMVRAKVSAIRASQEDQNSEARKEALRETEVFLDLAGECTHYGASQFLLITFGVSGSGKSLLSGQLVGPLGAIRIRSDIERQRRTTPGENRYSGFARQRTYARLESCADKVLGAGFPAIIDATFLTRQHRKRFWDLANEHSAPFVILSLSAPRNVLAHRVTTRQAEGKDPSEADVSVLDRQLEEMEPLTPREKEFSVEIESVVNADLAPVERFLRRAGRLPLGHRMRQYGSLPSEYQ
ncbi:MAG: AAA family ATPase [Gammaproteobacteria bacterium]|nr:AAA family ATPase [Gammaproteobacteria bacterium]MDH3411359.1 AAA family ATPase [Gammaproteobacteria bacterium]